MCLRLGSSKDLSQPRLSPSWEGFISSPAPSPRSHSCPGLPLPTLPPSAVCLWSSSPRGSAAISGQGLEREPAQRSRRERRRGGPLPRPGGCVCPLRAVALVLGAGLPEQAGQRGRPEKGGVFPWEGRWEGLRGVSRRGGGPGGADLGQAPAQRPGAQEAAAHLDMGEAARPRPLPRVPHLPGSLLPLQRPSSSSLLRPTLALWAG